MAGIKSAAMESAMRHSNKYGAGAAARRKAHLKPKEKVGVVMHEYKHGTLHSGGSGKIVTNPKQAVAIALSEAGLSRKK
jgi:hypothetical protein